MTKDLWRYVSSARRWLVATVTVGLLSAATTIVLLSALSSIVAGVFLAHQSLARVEPLLLILLAATATRAVLVWLREVTAQEGAIRVKAQLRERLCAHLLRLGPAYTRGERTGELVATAVEGVERLDPYVSRYLPQLALSAGVPLLIILYILPLDWASAVLLLVTGPVIPLLMILIGSYAEQRINNQWLALSRLSAHFLDAVQGLPTLIMLGRAGAERERVARVSDRFRERTMAALRLAFLSGMVLELMAAIAIALVAVQLGIRLLDGGITFERAFLVLLLAPEFYRPLRELGIHRHAGMEGSAAAARIAAILTTLAPSQVEVDQMYARTAQGSASYSERGEGELQRRCPGTPEEASPLPRTGRRYAPHGVRGEGVPLTLRLHDATYTYLGGDRPALAGVSLTLPAGTRTALVGRSGAGKTTLANLLLRFTEPQRGEITVNGAPLTSLPVEGWRERVALVPQRPYLFHGSVYDNIRLARPNASDAEVAWAAELAGATEFITRLPRGYATAIGERGARLSAGQAQRLAIARAFLKDAPLLILDEPTSSLDPHSEAVIRETLEKLMRDRTVLVIAHRLNTIAGAEQIVVLEHGRVAEIGRHHELLSHEGPYARLVGRRKEEMAPV